MLRRMLALAFISTALVLVACGGGDGDTDDGNNTDTLTGQDVIDQDQLVVNPDNGERDEITPPDANVDP
ncbi:MAG TPA: hypothetical protein PKK50_08175, partial [Myxococcota bacterium]|nr:hypothetical protein [Myxococcota bacterium]